MLHLLIVYKLAEHVSPEDAVINVVNPEMTKNTDFYREIFNEAMATDARGTRICRGVQIASSLITFCKRSANSKIRLH